MPETKTIALADINIDGGTQPRVAISENHVREYADHLQAGIVLPPVDVFFDGIGYWLADGFHRYLAVKRNEWLYITAVVHAGTKRDAVLFSVGANHSHGLRRTNEDKRKAVLTLLNDAEWVQWSDSEIARRCGVHRDVVVHAKSSLAVTASETEPARTYVDKHGTKTTMNVENIGRRTKDTTKREAIAEMLRAGASSAAVAEQLSASHTTISEVRRDIGLSVGPSKAPAEVQSRREQIREMAAVGHSSRQMAAALGLSEQSVRGTVRSEGIDVPADRATGKSHRHDSNRIVETMVMDAEHLTADENLIDFASLDRERIGQWCDSLVRSKKALDAFIRRLVKEQKNGKAA